MHNYTKFFVKLVSELYFFRLKMIKPKDISVKKRARIIILQKQAKTIEK